MNKNNPIGTGTGTLGNTNSCPTCQARPGDMIFGYWPYCSKLCRDVATPMPEPTNTLPYIPTITTDNTIKTTLDVQGTGNGTVNLYYYVCPCGVGFYRKDPVPLMAAAFCCDRCKERHEPRSYPSYNEMKFPEEKDDGWKSEFELMEKRRLDLVSLLKEIYKETDIVTVHRLIEEKFFR